MKVSSRSCALALATAGAAVLTAAPPSLQPASAVPVAFEQSGADWIARGSGYQLALRDGDAFLSLFDARGRMTSFEIMVTGRKSQPNASPEREALGRRNYLIGSDPTHWRSNVQLWDQVRFTGVLDGVDVVYRGSRGRLEYDFLIAPGANAAAIELAMRSRA